MTNLLDAREYQDKLLEELSREDYKKLAQRASRQRIGTPRNLRGLRLYVCCKPGDSGGVQVTVEAHKPFLLIFFGSSRPGFEKLCDGSILSIYDDTVED